MIFLGLSSTHWRRLLPFPSRRLKIGKAATKANAGYGKERLGDLEMTREEIIDHRKNKFLKIGRSKGFISNPENLTSLEVKKNYIGLFLDNKKYLLLIGFFISLISLLFFIL